MMYLLLRDNKQTGPYSLDDLKIKGLKAYDLVWVEGKSAAWRYPSEVNELSAFAPVVEEQPFDRFYKKPAAIITASQPLYSEEQAPATRKRTIYVTMPGAAAAPAPVTVRETIRTAPTVRPAATATALPIDDFAFNEPVSRLDNRPDHTKDYRNGELMPRSRFRKSVLLQPVLIGVGILVLLAGGIFIGLSLNKDNPVLQKIAARTAASDKGTADNSRPITPSTATPLPVPSAVIPVTATKPQSVNPAATTPDRDHVVTVAGKAGKIALARQKAIMPAGKTVLLSTAADSSLKVVAIVHREALHRTETTDNYNAADKGSLKVNLASQVSAGTNKYEVGTFGGISNLQVTVNNKSAYPLDLVVVEVQYIQANKKTYKTENLYFHSVGPGMALMQEAHKSSRGIRIEYKITQISSKELGISESGL